MHHHRRRQSSDQLAYDANSNATAVTLTDSDGNLTNYLYDPVGRLTGIWAPNYDMVSLGYDAGGRLTEKRIGNGADSQYTYNPDNTLASLTNKHGAATISSHLYSYDPLGNRATQAETINAAAINYTYQYDPLNRLTQVQNGTATQQENYQYDPLGNRTTKSIGATAPTITAYVYDTANQLKEIRSGSATGTLLASLAYDPDGNLTGRSDSGLTLTYDALNRLTATSQTGQPSQSYSYDDQGRRISKTIGTTTTNYLYNGPDIVAEYGATWGSPAAQYTHGPKIDDEIIRIAATGAQYFHQDGLNSVVGVTNSAGLTDATQRFDAWGNKLTTTGATPHYGYTGREPDETGLVYYRARYYDPTLGRFTQRDPIGLKGGLNRYAYVGGNPIMFTDPNGTWLIGGVYGAIMGALSGYASAKTLGGDSIDAAAAAATSAVVGLIVGAVLPDSIAGAMAASAAGAAAGDILGQLLANIAKNPTNPDPINIGEVIGAGIGGALAGLAPGEKIGVIIVSSELGFMGSTAGAGIGKALSLHGGGSTVGGTLGRQVSPMVVYAGNQK